MRVLTLSKPYVASAYRNKLAELARHDGITAGLIAPQIWGSQKWEDDAPREKTDAISTTSPAIWTRQLPIGLNGRNHFHFYCGLEKAVRDFRPDVFNIEEEHYSVVTWQAFRIAKKYGAIPLFYTWQNIFKKYPPPFSNIEKYIFKNCGAAVTGNSEASDVLRQKGFSGLIREIPQMGVELEQFAPENLAPETRRAAKKTMGLSSDDFWIGFAGRLVEEKGVQDLLHALTLCDANVKAVIIGDGPFAENLKNLAAGLLPPDRVRFISQVKSRDIAAYLRAIDALCLPSHTRPNWKEQFGRILIEAMAAGAVCIGSSSGEIPKVIGNAGLVFPEKDSQALAAAIRRLEKNPALTQSLQESALQRVETRYTNRIVAAQLVQLIREVSIKRPTNRS